MPLDEKMGYLNAEMAIDFSDVDNMNKLKCLACIPDDSNKQELWAKYVNKDLSQ